jgi:hypothetical protein
LFQHFLSFCWCLVALNICYLEPTLFQPLNVNVTQKLLSSRKNVLRKPLKSDADTLLNFAFQCRQNEKWSRKTTRVKTVHVHIMMPHGRLIHWAFRSVTLVSPLSFFHWGT